MANSHPANSQGPIDQLRKLQPQSLLVHLADGRDMSVAIPARKKKWAQVGATLEKLRWFQLEALDGKGQVLDVIDNEDGASELEDLEFDGAAGEQAKFLQLMLKAQDVALGRQASLIDTMLKNNLELSKTLMARLNALETSHGATLEALRELMTNDAGELQSGDAIAGMLGHLVTQKALPPAPTNSGKGKK